MDGFGCKGVVLWGNEKFWMIRNWLGLPGLGIIEKGEDWNEPMSDSVISRENGPM